MKLGKYTLDPIRVDYHARGLVVCEGFSDAMFIDALLQQRRIDTLEVGCPTQRTEIVKKDGRDGIPDYLLAVAAHRNRPSLRAVLVVIDADSDPATAFTFARDALANAGLPTPNAVGAVTDDGTMAVAVYLIPGDGANGTLEHLLVSAAFAVRPEMEPCIDALSDCAAHTAAWTENKKAKMRAQSIIASCCGSDPSSSLSTVWTRDDNPFPPSSPAFGQIGQLLTDLSAVIV